DADQTLFQIQFVGADDAVARLFAVFILDGYPGAEIHLVRIGRLLADDLELFQALGQKAHAAVDLPQHLLAVGVLGVFRAVALGRRLADRLCHLRSAHMPQLMQLGPQARFAFRRDQWGTGGARRAIAAHGLSVPGRGAKSSKPLSWFSAFAQHAQRAGTQRASGAENTGQADQQSAYHRQQKQPEVRLPAHVEGIAIEQETYQLAAQSSEQASGSTEQAELGAPGADEQPALGAQCAQQRALANAFVQCCLQPCEEDRNAGGEYEQQHVFNGQSDLGEDAAQLRQQRVDLQKRHAGEGAAELDEFRILAGRQVEAGQIGGGQVLQGLWFEDHVEIGLESVPVHLAQAGDLRFTFDAANVEAQAIANLEFQAFGQLGFDGNVRQLTGVCAVPPAACGDQVVRWLQFGPGQAQIALDSALTAAFLAHQLAHRLLVGQDQQARYHRIQRYWRGRQFGEARGDGIPFGRQYIEREVIGRIFRQLVLPGVQQLAAQQGDQRHGQQDQAEGQRLAGGGQRVAQQLPKTQ